MYNKIIKEIFIWRKRSLDKQIFKSNSLQSELIQKIISNNQSIPYLRQYSISDFNTFKQNCPAITYDELEPYITQLKNEHKNELTIHDIIAFSKSSGTTSRSKLIPMTKGNLNANFTAGKNLVSHFLSAFPESKIVTGKNFSLTGSYSLENGYVIGDVSALFTYYLKPWFRPFRSPDMHTATIANWDEKLKKMTPILAQEDIRWIAGVPSWMTIVIDSIENYTQKPIVKVWKNLEVFFYGGVQIDPFRAYFDTKFEGKIKLWQTYNASEGFFGLQTQSDSSNLSFLFDTDNYYEFIPKSEIESFQPILLNLSELIIGGIYELVITNLSGLYRYRIGDLIQITDLNPLKYQIVGRTKSFINVFGEELMVTNTELAVTKLSQEFNLKIKDYTVAPIVSGNQGYHHWMVEFESEVINLAILEEKLDEFLRELNSDYDAKRYQNYILQRLKIEILPSGTLENWLEKTNRKTVQAKVPKLANNMGVQDSIRASMTL